MATLKIYSGTTGMQQSVAQIDRLIAAELAEPTVPLKPREALSMMAVEEQLHSRGRRLADLWMAKAVLEAHLDVEFLTRSTEAAQQRLREDGARRIKSCGWKWTSVRLRGGLKLRLESPYLRATSAGRGGRRRRKRGQAGAGLFPLLWQLGVEQRLSPATRSEVARQSVLCSSFEETREQLARQGLELECSSVVQIAVSTGKKALELRQRALQTARQAPLPQHSSLAGQRVRISLDGGRARIRQTRRGRGIRPGKNGRRPFTRDWKEPRLLTIDVLDERGEPDRSRLPVYETSLGDAEQVLEMVLGTLRLLGVHLAKHVVFIADGADWIWRRIPEALSQAGVQPEKLTVVLDYYHATEYIADALAACKNLSSQQRETFFEELCRTLLEPRGAETVLERLRPLARGRRARFIQRKLQYLEKHLQQMPYASVRAAKLPIGSGVVESAIRRVINLRFKSASMCWRPDHLEPLLYLRAVLKAGRWDAFFAGLLRNSHWLEPSSAFSPIPKPKPRRRTSSPKRKAA